MKAIIELGREERPDMTYVGTCIVVEGETQEQLRLALDTAFASLDTQSAPETWLEEYGRVRWVEERRRATPQGSTRTLLAALTCGSDQLDRIWDCSLHRKTLLGGPWPYRIKRIFEPPTWTGADFALVLELEQA